jgi:hypothetical protein
MHLAFACAASAHALQGASYLAGIHNAHDVTRHLPTIDPRNESVDSEDMRGGGNSRSMYLSSYRQFLGYFLQIVRGIGVSTGCSGAAEPIYRHAHIHRFTWADPAATCLHARQLEMATGCCTSVPVP